MATETTFIGLKGGTTKVIPNIRPEDLKKVKEDSNVRTIETSKGQKIKEEIGSSNLQRMRTMAIEVGKTLVKALKQTGDEISRATVKNRTENSFKIYVIYITNHDDEFEFKVDSENKLHLINGKDDKILVDVGEESGNLKIEKAVLEDALETYLKELQGQIGKDLGVGSDQLEEETGGLESLTKIVVPIEQADDALEILTSEFKGKFLPMNPPGTFYFSKKGDISKVLGFLKEKGIEVEGEDIEENSEMGSTFTLNTDKVGYEEDQEESSDTVVLDIPLFVRVLEYVREDVKDDIKIHTITQQAIRIGQRGSKTLTMNDYNTLVEEDK